jgi:cation-transporting P-type ATPase E
MVLAYLGERVDAIFLISVIAVNTLIAIIQEMRAKWSLDRLSLLGTAPVERFIDTSQETVEKVSPKLLRVGDVISMHTGDQIPADGVVITPGIALSVNEALLTGEAEPIEKKEGDTLWSGSMVLSGQATVRLTAVGKDTRAEQITKKLRWYDNRLTPLQESLNKTIRWLTAVAVVTGFLVYINSIGSGIGAVDVVRSVVASSITLVPEGLILAATLLFSYGALQMSKHGVLVRRLGAIEAFGRLNYFALDKTGTITNNTPVLDSFVPFVPNGVERAMEGVAALAMAEGTALQALPSLQALAHKAPEIPGMIIHAHEAFSSRIKMSTVTYALPGKAKSNQHTFWMGAPDILRDYLKPTERLELDIAVELANGQGKRSIAALVDGELVALFLLVNELREGIADTLFYLQANGISLKVISGDHPTTVQAVAHSVGIRNSDRILTGNQLAGFTDQEWEDQIPATTIFARVLPEQKERIITVLKKRGFTGMVGDGVNDALAIKRSDLGVTVLDSSPATRSLADVVLMNNTFTSMPIGIRVGNQVIMGIELVAALFFNRIIATLTLIGFVLALETIYPLVPRHLVIMNLIIVGIPTLLWSLVPPESLGRRSAADFFKRVLRFALPNGILTGIAIAASSSFADNPPVVALMVITILGMYGMGLIPAALGAVDDQRQRSWRKAYILLAAAILIVIFIVPSLHAFFELGHIGLWDASVITIICTATAYVQRLVSRRCERLVAAELLTAIR